MPPRAPAPESELPESDVQERRVLATSQDLLGDLVAGESLLETDLQRGPLRPLLEGKSTLPLGRRWRHDRQHWYGSG